MVEQTEPVPGAWSWKNTSLPRLAKRYKVPLEVIADGKGEKLRSAGGIYLVAFAIMIQPGWKYLRS